MVKVETSIAFHQENKAALSKEDDRMGRQWTKLRASQANLSSKVWQAQMKTDPIQDTTRYSAGYQRISIIPEAASGMHM